MFDNPWENHRRPGVHPDDEPYVAAHNWLEGADDYRLITYAWPQPWIGTVERASVLVLAANPGWVEDDRPWEKTLAASFEDNLSGRRPNLFLDPWAEGSPGAKWYRKTLRALLAIAPTDEVAEAVCVVDFHAYHSPKWRSLPVTLPTQHYTFQKVRERLEDGAVVIITRARREWQIAVPELIDHERVFVTNSVQTSSLSSGNLSRPAWEAVVSRLPSAGLSDASTD
jgi:hypothetical protein